MNDDVSTTESNDPMSQDTAAEEPQEPMVEGSPEAAAEDGDDGGGAGMLGDIEIPSTGRMLVGIGGAAMALSTLFSWVEIGADSFPNIAGVGDSTDGIGLAVFLVGLSLLLRHKSMAATLGLALGAFGVTLTWIMLVGTDNDVLGFGAWLGLAATAVAVVGALLLVYESDERPSLDFHPMEGALGAALAIAAAIFLDWALAAAYFLGGGNPRLGEVVNGLNSDVLFGLPVLILGGIALVFIVELISVPRMVLEGRRQWLLMISQTAGMAIVVIAGSNVLGSAILGFRSFGSGPLVALVGGIILTRSIRQASNH